MKKLICLIIAAVAVFSLVACGSSATTNTNGGSQNAKTPVAATDGYVFNVNGTQIAMHADAAPIIAALGEAKSYSEEASCAFTGLDKTYFYGSFYLQTYPVGDKDYVFGVWFADDSVQTSEGIYIGMAQSDVEAKLGADSYNGSNAYILTKSTSKLTVIIKDGAVSSVQYDAVVD